MSAPGNTSAKRASDLFGPDLLSDPDFKPCREESCPRKDLHAEHELISHPGRKIHQGYSNCPECQTQLVVTKTKRKKSGSKRARPRIEARCPRCRWFHTKALKKAGNENA